MSSIFSLLLRIIFENVFKYLILTEKTQRRRINFKFACLYYNSRKFIKLIFIFEIG